MSSALELVCFLFVYLIQNYQTKKTNKKSGRKRVILHRCPVNKINYSQFQENWDVAGSVFCNTIKEIGKI